MSTRYPRAKILARGYIKRALTITVIAMIVAISIYIWQEQVTKHEVPKSILPKPSDIFSYFKKEFFSEHREGYNSLLEKSMSSFLDALLGFSIAAVLGSLIGIIFAKFKVILLTFKPPFFIIQLLPVPAFAPVIAAILGYGVNTKIFIIVLFIIFPFMVASYDAVRNIPENYKSLMCNYHAGRISTFKNLIIPSIVPNLLHTMRLSATASIVASIIAELPLSVSKGIGKDIFTSFNNQLIPRVWVSLIIISLISLGFFLVVTYFEKFINEKYKYGQF